jgi:Sec-independent protein translocase protein TatA
MRSCALLAILLCQVTTGCMAFVPTIPTGSKHGMNSQSDVNRERSSPFATAQYQLPVSVQRQRRSVANVQTMGLFGLGAPEIVVILVAVAFVVGPQQIGKMAGDFAGKAKGELNEMPEELKKIPEEFMKGVEEGEISSRARNAKPMKDTPKETEGSKKEDE